MVRGLGYYTVTLETVPLSDDPEERWECVGGVVYVTLIGLFRKRAAADGRCQLTERLITPGMCAPATYQSSSRQSLKCWLTVFGRYPRPRDGW